MIFSVPATSANMGPGFDCLGVALSFRNEVVVRRSKYFSVSIKGEGAEFLKSSKGNAFINIFNEYSKNLTGKIEPFRFEFTNAIPLSRGMGSSSAIIIAAIAAAYEMAGISLTKDKILGLALAHEPHPDNITPAVQGGFTVASVDHGKVHYVKTDMPKDLKAIMVIPDLHQSTNHSRTILPKKVTLKETVFNITHSSLLTAALLSGKYELLKVASQDCLHQEVRMQRVPELFDVQRISLEQGALMSTLSGSGSSFFSMVHCDDATRVSTKLKDKFPDFRIEIFDFDNDGLTITHSS